MRKQILSLTAAMVAIGMMTGCNEQPVVDAIAQNKPLIVKTLQSAAKAGALNGLKQWAAKKPEAANEAATALSQNINGTLMPYLDGGNLQSSEQVETLLNSSLFKNVPDEVKVSIIAAATILDLYLPVPDSNTFLTQDHVDYLKAFLTGLRNGCDSFTSKIIVNPKDIKKSWIHE